MEPANPQVSISIVSPGYHSAHAVQLDAASANSTSFSFLQSMGLQCEGATYSTSFAVNYVKFSLHGNPDTNFCHLSVVSSYCFSDPPAPEPGYYNASLTPGWEYHQYTCVARKSGYADFVIGVGCEADYDIPAFTWQLTDFDIHLVGTSITTFSTPTPTPPSSSSSRFYSNTTSCPTTSPTTTVSTTTGPSNTQTGPTNTQTGPTNTQTGPTNTQMGPTNVQTSSTNVPVTLTNNPTTTVNVPPSTTTAAPGLTSPSPITVNKACRAVEGSFFLGPLGLVLLLPYVL